MFKKKLNEDWQIFNLDLSHLLADKHSLISTPLHIMSVVSKKIKQTASENHENCEYEIISSGDRYTRYVKPYFQDFRTFAKGRWLGREILEVFCREFGAHPPSYWVNAMRNGQVKINNT